MFSVEHKKSFITSGLSSGFANNKGADQLDGQFDQSLCFGKYNMKTYMAADGRFVNPKAKGLDNSCELSAGRQFT